MIAMQLEPRANKLTGILIIGFKGLLSLAKQIEVVDNGLLEGARSGSEQV